MAACDGGFGGIDYCESACEYGDSDACGYACDAGLTSYCEATDDGICDSSDASDSADCDGYCDSGDAADSADCQISTCPGYATLNDAGTACSTGYAQLDTQCGMDHVIFTLEECQAAAASLGLIDLVTAPIEAGPEWATGCLVNDGVVYFSAFADGSTENPTSGFVCKTDAFNYQRSPCADTGSALLSSDECDEAATALGYITIGDAGPEWASGCLVHGGGAFYSEEVEGSTEDPVDAYICSTDVMVTFSVDLNCSGASVDTSTGQQLWLMGSFNGWTPEYAMTDDDDDGVYTTTLRMEPGQSIQYKFTLGWSDNPWFAPEDSWDGACFADGNRSLVATTGGTIEHAFGSCSLCD